MKKIAKRQRPSPKGKAMRRRFEDSRHVKGKRKWSKRSSQSPHSARNPHPTPRSGNTRRRSTTGTRKKIEGLHETVEEKDEESDKIEHSSGDEEPLFLGTSGPTSSLMSKFEDRLRGGHFRLLNQSLYLSSGKESLAKFKKNENLFHEYHRGYLQSMRQWSVQPVEVAVRWLRKQKPHQKIVDYGCGEAKIKKANLPHNIISLDFVALHADVISCDMSHSPVESASTDIAIFSLSLMGTDYHECLKDAARVLRIEGILWIAEVCSRFANKSGKEEYHSFFEALEKLGFERVLAKKPSPIFVVLIFKKVKDVNGKTRIHWPSLKPCLYKKR